MRAPSRFLAATLACLTLALGWPPPAAAQDDLASLRLVAQPIWHDADDGLDIVVKVVNHSLADLEDFTLTVAAHARVTNRSSLHGTFAEDVDLPDLSTLPVTIEEAVPAGEELRVDIDLRLEEFASLAGATNTGVYPMTISLVSPGGTVVDSFATSLLYYPSPPEQRLMLVPVLPINAPPGRGPTNLFAPDDAGQVPLEVATGPNGWLRGYVDALNDTAGELPPIVTRERVRVRDGRRRRFRIVRTETQRPSVHLGVAITPRLVEELADMADGYRRGPDDSVEEVRAADEGAANARTVLTELEQLLGEEGIQPLMVPYAFPDLPTLGEALGPEAIGLQLDHGANVLRDVLGLDAGAGWLFPPAGRLDATTLTELRTDTAEHTFFREDAFADQEEPPEACPDGSPSFTCAVSVRGTAGISEGFVTDEGIQERLGLLGVAGNDRLDLQRFFAETSMIFEELPGTPGRVVQFTIPSLWQPKPAFSRLLFEGLQNAPWIRTTTPKEGIRNVNVEVRSRRLVTSVPPLREVPDPSFFSAIADAADLVTSFDLVRPPSDLVRRLLRNVLVAQSRMWWRSPESVLLGRSYADGAMERAQKELSRLSLGGPADVTLTSRQGEILFVVSNEATYPATFGLRVDPSRSDVEIEPRDFEDQRIDPGVTRQFTLRARTRSVISPIEVELTTPDGSYVIASKVINIRSTDFNDIALGITLGAFAFLVLFYLVRALRRRRTAAAQ